MKSKKFITEWRSTVGRITKKCSSTWGGTDLPHPRDAPCHFEVKSKSIADGNGGDIERMDRHWVCHCETPLCQFVDYQEVRAVKMRLYEEDNK